MSSSYTKLAASNQKISFKATFQKTFPWPVSRNSYNDDKKHATALP